MIALNKWISGEWVIDRTNAKQRRVLHYWFTILWFTVGLVLWIVSSERALVRRLHVAIRDLDHAPRRVGC